jgi:hypothetical protein
MNINREPCQMTVADVLAYTYLRIFTSGRIEHTPTDLLDAYPKTQVCRCTSQCPEGQSIYPKI